MAKPRPDINIKVATFTVSEKSINTFHVYIVSVNRRQTELVLEMTRYLTCQVLNRRNQGNNYKMPNLRAFMSRTERQVSVQDDGM